MMLKALGTLAPWKAADPAPTLKTSLVKATCRSNLESKSMN
jgi:hypothetical protein